MNAAESNVKVRQMVFLDLEPIFAIDKAIRAGGPSATYSGFTTPQVFGMEMPEPDSAKRPSILEVARLIELGCVAEDRGKTCGFVLGRQTYLAERDIEEGEIAIIGVHPDYQGKGVAGKLVDAICNLFQARGVHRVRIALDPLDISMQAFFERVGFSGQHLLYYHKTL